MTAALPLLRALLHCERCGDSSACRDAHRHIRGARAEHALERDLPDALRRVAAVFGAGVRRAAHSSAAAAAGGAAGEAFALAGRRAAAGEEIAGALARRWDSARGLPRRRSRCNCGREATSGAPAFAREPARRAPRRQRGDPSADCAGAVVRARRAAAARRRAGARGTAGRGRGEAPADDGAWSRHRGGRGGTRPRRSARDPHDRARHRLSTALAGLAVVLALAGISPRARLLLGARLLAACAVTWHALGSSAAVVDGGVGALVLGLRRRTVVARARTTRRS